MGWETVSANHTKAFLLLALVLGLLACNKPGPEQISQQPVFKPIYLELKSESVRKVDSVLAGRHVIKAIFSQTTSDSTGRSIDLVVLSLIIRHGNDTYLSELDAKSNRLLRLKQGVVPVTFRAELPFYRNERINTTYHQQVNSNYIDFYIQVDGSVARVRDWEKETRAK